VHPHHGNDLDKDSSVSVRTWSFAVLPCHAQPLPNPGAARLRRSATRQRVLARHRQFPTGVFGEHSGVGQIPVRTLREATAPSVATQYGLQARCASLKIRTWLLR
jgi:hypothetical protein